MFSLLVVIILFIFCYFIIEPWYDLYVTNRLIDLSFWV